jgi:hypothetical protein
VPLRFYVDRQLADARPADLMMIVNHLNDVYSKTTELRLSYDGYTIVPDSHVIQGSKTRIDVRLKYADHHDGGLNNLAVVCDTPNVRGDNYQLCATIAHEIGHYVRLWEFYSAWTMRDLTGLLPSADIRDGQGDYWNARPLVKRDPGIGFGWDVTNIETWLEHCQLCPLSSYLVNQYVALGERFFDDERFAVPVNPVEVKVQTEPGAFVRMFGLQNDSVTKTQTTPMRAVFADQDGLAAFEWGGGDFIATQGNHARLFHALRGNRSGREWLTVHDLHAHKVLGGGAAGDFHYHGVLPIALN